MTTTKVPRIAAVLILGAVGLILPLLPSGAESKVMAVKGGRVVPMSGGELEPGVVIIENGKIKLVGKDIPIPAGAETIDASRCWILPGLIEAHSTLGMGGDSGPAEGDELSDPTTPQLLVIDGINPFDKGFRRAREAGITAAFIAPGRGNVIGGQAAVLKPAGDTVEAMTVLSPAGVKFSLGEGPKEAFGGKGRLPSTRMGSAYVVRKALIEAGEYLKKWKESGVKKAGPKVKKDGESPSFKRDLALEPLALLLDGKLTAFVESYRADDIMTALRLVDEFKLKAVILGGTESYKIAGEIARRGIPVIFGPMGIGPKRTETEEVRIDTPAVLAKAGIKVVLQAEGVLGLGAQEELTLSAALAVKGGLDRDLALRAVTLGAAEVLGVAGRVGSLEPGKDGDLVVFDGDPLSYRTRVERVIINGRTVYERKKGG